MLLRRSPVAPPRAAASTVRLTTTARLLLGVPVRESYGLCAVRRSQYDADMEEDPLKKLKRLLGGSPLMKLLEQMKKVEGDQRSLVMVTHGFIEVIVNDLIMHFCKNGKSISGSGNGKNKGNRDYPHSVKVTLLHELGVISDHHFKLLTWFRQLRNDVAHHWDFVVTDGELAEFEMSDHRDPLKFADLCRLIVSDLWMQHPAIIGYTVAPAAYELSQESVLMMEMPAPKYRIPLKSDPKTTHIRAHDEEKQKAYDARQTGVTMTS
jgi:hypothetical protein